jgi:hypothetical protein
LVSLIFLLCYSFLARGCQHIDVHNHASGKMHMMKLTTPSRDISESINA